MITSRRNYLCLMLWRYLKMGFNENELIIINILSIHLFLFTVSGFVHFYRSIPIFIDDWQNKFRYLSTFIDKRVWNMALCKMNDQHVIKEKLKSDDIFLPIWITNEITSTSMDSDFDLFFNKICWSLSHPLIDRTTW